MLSGALSAVGLGARPAPREAPGASAFPGNPFTHDEARYDRFRSLQDAAPKAVMAGVSLAWVRAATSAGAALPKRLSKSTLPILLVSAPGDTVVDARDHARVIAAAPKGRLVRIEDARHEILVERDDLRGQFWAAFDQFLSEVLG